MRTMETTDRDVAMNQVLRSSLFRPSRNGTDLVSLDPAVCVDSDFDVAARAGHLRYGALLDAQGFSEKGLGAV